MYSDPGGRGASWRRVPNQVGNVMAKYLAPTVRRCVGVFVAGLMTLATFGEPARAQGVRVESIDANHAGEFVVPIGKSQILELDVPSA